MLALAASPTFAIMALLSTVAESDPAAILCSGGQMSPLAGMGLMYLLMGTFHVSPWLRLIRDRR